MTLTTDNWDNGYGNNKAPALRLVGSVETKLRALLGAPVDRLPRTPLLAMMAFYWYERMLHVRKAEGRHVDTGWMTEHWFFGELRWFAELADCLVVNVEVLPQETHSTDT